MLAKFILVSLFVSAAFAAPVGDRHSVDRCPMEIIRAAAPPFERRTLDFSSVVTIKPGAALSQKRQEVIGLILQWINSKKVNFGGSFRYEDFIAGVQAYDKQWNALLSTGMQGTEWALSLERSCELPDVRFGIDLSVRTRGEELDLEFKLTHWTSDRRSHALPGTPRFYRDIVTQLEGQLYSLDTPLSARPVVFRSGEGHKLIQLFEARRGVPLIYLTPKADTGEYPANPRELAANLAGRALVVQIEPGLGSELQGLGYRILNTAGRVAIFDSKGAMRLMPGQGEFPYTLAQIEKQIPLSTGAVPSR